MLPRPTDGYLSGGCGARRAKPGPLGLPPRTVLAASETPVRSGAVYSWGLDRSAGRSGTSRIASVGSRFGLDYIPAARFVVRRCARRLCRRALQFAHVRVARAPRVVVLWRPRPHARGL